MKKLLQSACILVVLILILLVAFLFIKNKNNSDKPIKKESKYELLSNSNNISLYISSYEQYIELKDDKGRYLGGKLPFENKYKDEAFEIAKNAVESMGGLKGFVGVDMIINADEKDIYSVYLLEINSRFTTPYVGLKQVSNINIGDSIIKLIDGKMDIDDLDISLDGEVEFKKSVDSLEIRRL